MTTLTVVSDHLTTVNPVRDDLELITDDRLRSDPAAITYFVRNPQLITDGRVADYHTALSHLIQTKKG